MTLAKTSRHVPYEIVDLRSTFPSLMSTSSLTNKNIAVPEGHYEENSMKITVGTK